MSARSTNLVPVPTTFFGRRRDLEDLRAAFDGGRRLLTLVAPAGAGKTRLAHRFAETCLGELSRNGGVWFCDLTEARDLDAVCTTVAGVLGVALLSTKTSSEAVARLGDALSRRERILLVLDNCEQAV